MAYTVLARRYRSATFDEVVGQNHVAQTLKRAIESGRIAHAYLFCGTRGVGKTSMARILAKALNCLNAKGPTATPCLQCDSCKAIARGEDMDVIEIDAASNTQVEKTREVVLESAQYRPARARFKIFIIDEVHMLSKASFNALLKTLEEPPEHVKFILATTEAEKILPTILSRCQRYDFRNIPTREIAGHLKEIVKQEEIKADDDALLMVARAGAGSMRDSLSLLDRVLSLGEKQVTVETIQQLLGLPKAQLIYDLAQAIGEGRVKDVLTQADQMITEGMATDSLLTWLSEHLRNLLVIRTCGMESGLVEIPGLSPAQLTKQAQQFEPMVLTQDITILEELKRQLRSTAAGRALLDATLVRLAMAEQFASVAELLARVDGGGGAGVAQKKKHEVRGAGSGFGVQGSVGAAGVGDGVARAAVREAFAPGGTGVSAGSVGQDAEHGRGAHATTELPGGTGVSAGSAASSSSSDDDDDLPRPGKVWDNSGPSLSELLKQHSASAPEPAIEATVPAAANVEPVTTADVSRLWPMLLTTLGQQQGGNMFSSVLGMAEFRGIRENQAVIGLPSHCETYARTWSQNGKKDTISKVLSGLLGQDIGVKFEVEAEPSAGGNGNGHAAAATIVPAVPVVTAPPAAPMPSRAAVQVAPRAAVAPMAAPAMPPQRLTADQIEEFQKDPLIGALIDQLGGQVLKLSEE